LVTPRILLQPPNPFTFELCVNFRGTRQRKTKVGRRTSERKKVYDTDTRKLHFTNMQRKRKQLPVPCRGGRKVTEDRRDLGLINHPVVVAVYSVSSPDWFLQSVSLSFVSIYKTLTAGGVDSPKSAMSGNVERNRKEGEVLRQLSRNPSETCDPDHGRGKCLPFRIRINLNLSDFRFYFYHPEGISFFSVNCLRGVHCPVPPWSLLNPCIIEVFEYTPENAELGIAE